MLSEPRSQRRVLYVGYDAHNLSRHFLEPLFGLPVDWIDWPIEVMLMGARQTKRRIFEEANSKDYAAVVVALSYDPFLYVSELEQLRRLAPLVGMFTDDIHTPDYSLGVASRCDLVLTTDPQMLDFYWKSGVAARLHLLDTSPEVWVQPNLKKSIDLILYGTSAKGRRVEIEAVLSDFHDLNILDLTDKRVPLAELVDAVGRSRLTINWSAARDAPLPNNFRDPNLGRYRQLKGRVFESLLAGCLPLTSPYEGYVGIFGDNLPTFGDRQELVQLVTRYSQNETERANLTVRLRAMAVAYLERLRTPIDTASLAPVGIREEPSINLVDGVTATYRAVDVWRSLSRRKVGTAVHDAKSVHWDKVLWWFLARAALRTLTNGSGR